MDLLQHRALPNFYFPRRRPTTSAPQGVELGKRDFMGAA
jgi:hypothetical protein